MLFQFNKQTPKTSVTKCNKNLDLGGFVLALYK